LHQKFTFNLLKSFIMATWDTKDYGWGSSVKAPSYFENFGSAKDSVFSNAWKTGFDAENAGENISNVFSNLFDKAKKTDKYRNWGERGYQGRSQTPGVSWGVGNSGGSFQAGQDLWGVYPQQHSPLVIEGTRGKGGLFGQAGGLAGSLGTAFGIFGPLGAPIGAAVGGLIDSAT
jgi:hypothetical protein